MYYFDCTNLFTFRDQSTRVTRGNKPFNIINVIYVFYKKLTVVKRMNRDGDRNGEELPCLLMAQNTAKVLPYYSENH